jgi:cardiolipin synthase A/B
MPKKILTDFTYHNQVRLIRGGLEYFDLLEKLIDHAEKSIYFQIYIFDEDDTGRRIAKSLMAAANRKVTVHLLLDGYASKSLSTEFIQEMKDAGIHFKWFTSFIKNKKIYLGRRLHHKVIVIDSKKSLVCGLNISDRYNDTPESIAWLDWAAYAEGEVSVDLEQVCKRRIKDYSAHALNKQSQTKAGEKDKDSCAVKIIVNDWGGRKSEITKSYLHMLKSATSHIIIMSPYFLPGREFRKRLRQATQRGVNVQVILTGVSDISLAKYGERYLYDWLMRYNIQIFEYQKNVLHGKMATCDGHWTTVGSYNVNNLSAYASIELNLEIKNDAFAKQAEDALEDIIEKECVHITKESYKREINILKRILQGAAYNILRFMLVLFTFRKRQQE